MGMGSKGAALGTFLAEIVPTYLVIRWSFKDGLLGLPTNLRSVPLVLERSKKPLVGASLGLVASLVGIALNRWLGPEGAKRWSLAHTACDVVGGISLALWYIGAKHYTLNLRDKIMASAIWRWADKWGLVISTAGAVVSALVDPIAPLIVVVYCLAKRQAFLRYREATAEGFNAQGRGKTAYAVCCIVGYGILVLAVEPSTWAAVAVYTTAQVAQIMAMRD